MTKVLNLSIGGIVMELAVGPTVDHIQLQKSFIPFQTDHPATSRFLVHYEEQSIQPTDICKLNTNAGWQIFERGNRFVVHIDASETNSEAFMTVTQDFSTGDIFFPEGRARLGFLPPTLARMIIISLLSQGHGVMLHAAGVRVGNKGLLFAGTDGVGKTTTARLWSAYGNATIIGDDHVIVRKLQGRFWMYSTPWHGIDCATDSVSVDRVFIIRQGKKNQIEPMPPVQVAAQLLRRSFPPLWSADGITFTLEFLEQLCASVPVHDFAFVPDQSAVDIIQCMDAA